MTAGDTPFVTRGQPTTMDDAVFDASVPVGQIDDLPESPVGSREIRQAYAIQWWWSTDMSNEEIGDRLGVRPTTVKDYVHEGPGREVKQMMAAKEKQVRLVAVQELQEQLREVGTKSKTAETAVKIWADDDGNVMVKDVRDEEGDVVKRYPVPQDVEIGDDEQARFYRRSEAREILDMLLDITGGWDPVEVELDGEVNVDAGDVEGIL